MAVLKAFRGIRPPVELAKDVASRPYDVLNSDERILKDPEAIVVLDAFGDSSVNVGVRAWVKTDDYWDVFYAMNERVYTEFGEAGLSIPFPQMDVHLKDAK